MYYLFMTMFLDNLIVVCAASRYGCCPDGVSEAEGDNYLGCPSSDPIARGACIETYYGCCIDGVTPAKGPFMKGCNDVNCKVSYTYYTETIWYHGLSLSLHWKNRHLKLFKQLPSNVVNFRNQILQKFINNVLQTHYQIYYVLNSVIMMYYITLIQYKL